MENSCEWQLLTTIQPLRATSHSACRENKVLKEIRSCKNKILGGSVTANDLQTSGRKQLLSMSTSIRMFGPLVVTVIARKLAS